MSYAPHRAMLATPVGTVVVEGDARALTAIRILQSSVSQIDVLDMAPPAGSPVAVAVTQLGEYFAGKRRLFDLPLQPLKSVRGTALRGAIVAVGFGETMTYGALAIAHDSGARAVGGACRRNPYPIVIPCHRVTSSSGAEHYSAGDGPTTKAWLLAHEMRMTDTQTMETTS